MGLTVRPNCDVCDSEPVLAPTWMGKLPTAAEEGTENVTIWPCPGATVNGGGGDELTPVGKPESVTVTASENPSCPLIAIETGALCVPSVTATWSGAVETLKSLADWTVKASAAECARAPAVPFAITLKLPAVAADGIDSVTAWLPLAATLNGAAGTTVAPSGNPENVTLTGSANPFWLVIETVKDVAPPASAVMVAGDTAMLKSLGGGV